MKFKFPPIKTVVAFLDSLGLNAQFYYENGKLAADCYDKNSKQFKVLFKHFDIECSSIPDIKQKWVDFIFENDKAFFKEYCAYYHRKNEAAINGANKFLDHLEAQGYIVRNQDDACDKTID